MKQPIGKFLTAALLTGCTGQAAALSLQFDYTFDTNNFFGAAGSIQRTLLESAGSFFEGVIGDSLTAIAPDANNQFNAVFQNPGTGALETVFNLNVPTDTLIIYAGGRSLGGGTLGQGGPGGFSIPSAQSLAFIDNASARGQAGALTNPETDFGPWGGALTFDSDGSTNWYFDADLATDADVINIDFYSVALHELGHLLGIGTADSWDALISGNDFTGSASTTVFGGLVPLTGDGGHWVNGTLGNGGSQEAAMDPSITNGTRKRFTDLDLAGLADVGWEVTVVPIPPAIWLFASAVTAVFTIRRRG